MQLCTHENCKDYNKAITQNCIDCDGDSKYEPKPEEAQADEQISSVIGSDSGWIDCNDRLPKIKENVLVSDGNIISIGYLIKFENSDNTHFLRSTLMKDPIYWRPLPKLPNH